MPGPSATNMFINLLSIAGMESSTQLSNTSTAKNFEYEYWHWKMYSSTSTVKKFEYEYFSSLAKEVFKLQELKICRKNINEYVFFLWVGF